MTAATAERKVQSDSGVPAPAGFRSLLVPIDLTQSSDRPLGRVPLLPLAGAARVTLLHVVPGGLAPVEQRRAVLDANRALAEEVHHLRQLLPKQTIVEAVVKSGSAAKEIAASTRQARSELLVMGRGGGRPFRDTFLGSTAERVIRQTKLPVLVVRRPARSAYRRPALALDLDPAAHEVVRLMLRLLPAPRPRVEVIHAFDVPYRGMLYPSLPEHEAKARTDELHVKATRKLAKVLATALSEADIPARDAPSWKTHVRFGHARLVVEKAIAKAETDLLVLGTRGHSGAAYVFLGSVAGELLRTAKCDVLVVPPARG